MSPKIKVLMSHPMETGQRKDSDGTTVPAHFIQTHDGRRRWQDGDLRPDRATSVSRNPVFGFKVKGAKAGDKVVVNWIDNKGDKRTDEAAVA